MEGILRMDLMVKVRIAGFYAKEIPMRASIEPFFIYLAGLLAKREGDAQGLSARIYCLDCLEQAGNFADEGGISPLAALDHNGTETPPGGRFRSLQHLLIAEFISRAADIPPDAAVEAVLCTYIGYLYQAPQIHLWPYFPKLDIVCLLQQGPVEFRIPAFDGFGQALPVQNDIHFLFKDSNKKEKKAIFVQLNLASD